MTKWLLRGLVFAALMVVVRVVQGALINQWETKTGLISLVLLIIFAVLVFVWGFIDGRADAVANPDPDRRADLAMTWLGAGLVAGALSGAVAWFISLFYPPLYAEGLVNELTAFAAFTALLVFVPAVAGVAIGRWLTDRRADKVVRVGRADAGYEQADTDVFAAVGATGSEEQTAWVTTAQDEDAPAPTTARGEDQP